MEAESQESNEGQDSKESKQDFADTKHLQEPLIDSNDAQPDANGADAESDQPDAVMQEEPITGDAAASSDVEMQASVDAQQQDNASTLEREQQDDPIVVPQQPQRKPKKPRKRNTEDLSLKSVEVRAFPINFTKFVCSDTPRSRP